MPRCSQKYQAAAPVAVNRSGVVGCRLIEVGGVLTAVLLLIPWTAWLGWAASVLLGVGPFIAYVASRSVGVPGDRGDVGRLGQLPRWGSS
jgi:hypothetical protein